MMRKPFDENKVRRAPNGRFTKTEHDEQFALDLVDRRPGDTISEENRYVAAIYRTGSETASARYGIPKEIGPAAFHAAVRTAARDDLRTGELRFRREFDNYEKERCDLAHSSLPVYKDSHGGYPANVEGVGNRWYERSWLTPDGHRIMAQRSIEVVPIRDGKPVTYRVLPARDLEYDIKTTTNFYVDGQLQEEIVDNGEQRYHSIEEVAQDAVAQQSDPWRGVYPEYF